MAALLHIMCMIFLVSIAQSSKHSSTTFPDANNNHTTFLPMFKDINKMMELMHQRFQRLFNLSSFPMEDRTELDALEPVCTTTINTPPTSISPQKARRKKFRQTQTTICTKELILNGKKQFYKEMNITNDKGILISQSKIYQTITLTTNNETISTNPNIDQNVISY